MISLTRTHTHKMNRDKQPKLEEAAFPMSKYYFYREVNKINFPFKQMHFHKTFARKNYTNILDRISESSFFAFLFLLFPFEGFLFSFFYSFVVTPVRIFVLFSSMYFGYCIAN